MSPLVLGPRAHRPLRGAVAAARHRRRRARPTALRRRLRRVQAPAPRPSVAADPRSGRGPRVRRRRARPRALDVLDDASTSTATIRCSRDGFVYGMVVQHEHQHDETLLATIQLMDDFAHPDAAGRRPTPARRDGASDPSARRSLIAGGTYVIGTDDDPWAYDNERPAHDVELAPFRIDTHAGHEPRVPRRSSTPAATTTRGCWSDAGWAWRQEAGARRPAVLAPRGRRRAGRVAVRPRARTCRPTSRCSTCAGTRPTRSPAGRRTPAHRGRVGDAASGADRGAPTSGTAPLGPTPSARTPAGEPVRARTRCSATCGSGPRPTSPAYPGFVSFPYREYSEVFFGPDYKVLRGGSWATHPSVRRATFRNWDYPIRRQIFSGFRCAADA